MKDLVLKCFFSNAVEGGKLRVEELNLEKYIEYIDFKVNIINNIINIYDNDNKVIVKKYDIKKTKILYESNIGDELIIEYKGQVTKFYI